MEKFSKKRLTWLTSGGIIIVFNELVITNLDGSVVKAMNLNDAVVGQEYIVKAIDTDDEEMDAFLFSLGCYSGEPVTVVSHIKAGCVVSIKDGRYTIDHELARAILV